MPVQVIATPYGARALDALVDVVREAKADDPMAPVTLLLPNNLAGIVARRHLAAGIGASRHLAAGTKAGGESKGGNGVAGLRLATVTRLAEQLAAPSLAPRRPATSPVLAAAWRAALGAGSSVFDPVRQHPATIRALVSASRELRDLSVAGLDQVGAASALAGELVRLHRVVRESLIDSWYDETDLLDTACSAVAEDQDQHTGQELGTIVLYLPQELTLAESRLTQALAERAELTAVVGTTDVRRADRAVHRSLARIGATVTLASSSPASAGSASAGPASTTPASPRPRVAHEVRHASDSDDEVRCVVRDVVSVLGSVPAHRVAVLYGATHPYARLLHEHLGAAGITVNGAGTRPVIERAIARGFVDVLSLAHDDVPRADFFTAVSEAPTRSFDGARVPAARWERLSRSAAVISGDDWAERLQAHADALAQDIAAEQESDDAVTSRIERSQRDLESALALRDFATRLRRRLHEGLALTTWSALSAWASDLFATLYGDARALGQLPAEEQYAATTVGGILRGLADLDAFESSSDLRGLIEVLTLELEAALPRVGRFGEGVLVTPLSASVGLAVDVVYVVGLAEDAYPGRLREDALLLDRVREASAGELASYRDALDAKHRHLMAAFDAAPRVVATFPRGDLRRSTRRLPSRWLLWTLRELSGNRDLAATEWESATSPLVTGSPSYAASLTSLALPASEQEWRAKAAAVGAALPDAVVAAGRELVRARTSDAFTRFDGNLAGVTGLTDFADGFRRVSPTALEFYAICPHAYFMERLLRVSPLEQPEAIISISPLDVGNLMHETMDEFITGCAGSLPGYGEPWSAEQRARLREIAEARAAAFEKRGSTGHERLWQTERDRILGDLDDMLDDDDRRRADRDSRVLGSELAFGMRGADPVRIAVDGGTVLLRGSADKVDQARDGTLIVIDLKTGSTRRFEAMRSDELAKGTKLQLPVYAQAALQLLGGSSAEAAYWFVRKGKRGWIDVQLTAELQERYTAAVATLVRSIAAGRFPAKAPDVPDFAWVQCAYCNPDGLGHGEVRSRWESKRHDPVLHDLVALIEPPAEAP